MTSDTKLQFPKLTPIDIVESALRSFDEDRETAIKITISNGLAHGSGFVVSVTEQNAKLFVGLYNTSDNSYHTALLDDASIITVQCIDKHIELFGGQRLSEERNKVLSKIENIIDTAFLASPALLKEKLSHKTTLVVVKDSYLSHRVAGQAVLARTLDVLGKLLVDEEFAGGIQSLSGIDICIVDEENCCTVKQDNTKLLISVSGDNLSEQKLEQLAVLIDKSF